VVHRPTKNVSQEAYEDYARLAGLSEDRDVQNFIAEAADIFEHHGQRSWLSWAGDRFMPRMAREIEQEKAADAAAERERAKKEREDELRVQAMERETARIQRRSKREDEHNRARNALLADHKAKRITLDEFAAAIQALDSKRDAADQEDAVDDDGEVEVVNDEDDDDQAEDDDGDGEDQLIDEDDEDDDDDDDAIASRATGKRKRRKTSLGDGIVQMEKVCCIYYALRVY
jgi:hypothetical protein